MRGLDLVFGQLRKSGKVDVTGDPGFTGSVKEPDEGGTFGGAGLAAKDQNDTHMGDVLRFGHEVFPVAGDDYVAAFGGVAQDGGVVGRNGKDIAQDDNLMPQGRSE